jgi:hypothetical protein
MLPPTHLIGCARDLSINLLLRITSRALDVGFMSRSRNASGGPATSFRFEKRLVLGCVWFGFCTLKAKSQTKGLNLESSFF